MSDDFVLNRLVKAGQPHRPILVMSRSTGEFTIADDVTLGEARDMLRILATRLLVHLAPIGDAAEQLVCAYSDAAADGSRTNLDGMNRPPWTEASVLWQRLANAITAAHGKLS